MSNPTTPKLKWLFTAHFSDGSFIDQTQEDKCLTRTDGSGSTFTDVLAKEDLLTGFGLTDGKDVVYVDLKTGLFTVNNVTLHLHNQFFEPEKYKLDLVYFRETVSEQLVGSKLQTLSTKHYVKRYFIGWKTTVNGKEKQVTLAVE